MSYTLTTAPKIKGYSLTNRTEKCKLGLGYTDWMLLNCQNQFLFLFYFFLDGLLNDQLFTIHWQISWLPAPRAHAYASIRVLISQRRSVQGAVHGQLPTQRTGMKFVICNMCHNNGNCMTSLARCDVIMAVRCNFLVLPVSC